MGRRDVGSTGSMTEPSSPSADDATVPQSSSPAPGETGAAGSPDREVGVTAAVERGPAETSSEGEPVREDEHVSLTGEEPARSTDDL